MLMIYHGGVMMKDAKVYFETPEVKRLAEKERQRLTQRMELRRVMDIHWAK